MIRRAVRLVVAAGALALAAVWIAAAPRGPWAVARAAEEEEEGDPPEVVAGERLFLETRFAQHFFEKSGGDVNAYGVPRDPSLDRTVTTDDSLRGPFSGKSMNCRACHLVDEHRGTRGGGVRTYADFARRSPIPDRGDGGVTTLRNSPSLVGASRRRTGASLLHFDGEFGTPEDLVVGTFTGRNFGWLPTERDTAIRHIARVLRRDDGRGALAQEFGGISYARLLTGEAGAIPAEFRIPTGFRTDVANASDEELVRGAAKLVGVYLRSLEFARNARGEHAGSAYDRFLRKNGLPRAPRGSEAPQRYTARLRAAVFRDVPRGFVDERGGSLALHGRQASVFRERELRGLRVFLTRPEDAPGATSGVGNCSACHTPPEFTDFSFRSTGVSQIEFDAVHGAGAFLELEVPSLAARNANRDAYLPPTPERPSALGPFAQIPSLAAPGHADLGLWNVLFDPDRPAPQAKLVKSLTASAGSGLSDEEYLARALGAFKTPSIRDLGQSSPYMHDGSLDSREDVVRFYVRVSDLARGGALRNPDPAIAGIRLDEGDVKDLAAFLVSLDEDYE
jgi:cytochrome c peroxidase